MNASKASRVVARLAWATVVAGAVLGGTYFALFRLAVKSPAGPRLSAEPRRDAIVVDGRARTFTYFAPRDAPPKPGLLIAYHGGGGSSEQMRAHTAFEFEEIADRDGIVVVYPQAYEGTWNTCQKGRNAAATQRGVDDVGFTRQLIAWFDAKLGVDRSKVVAVGFSNGGHMVYRLAIEMPDEIAAFAAISANQPAAEDSQCPASTRPVSLAIINGTKDPINPYGGGDLSPYGLWRFGPVLSTLATAAHFVPKDGPRFESTVRYPDSDGNPSTWVEKRTWYAGAAWEVVALSVHGGGHSVPQGKFGFPIGFGPTSAEIDAPNEVWSFFRHREQVRRGRAPGGSESNTSARE
jgi:polyhydroxybutyrate depolymerase